MRWRRWAMPLAFLSVVAAGAGISFSGAPLIWLGEYLDREDPPVPSEMISVLGGDLRGSRIVAAARLAKSGYAKAVLVSGAGSLYGRHESDLAIAYAVSKGYEPELFLPLRYPAESTRDEVRAIVQELRRRGVKSFLVVTSTYHTRRARAIFEKDAAGLKFRVVGVPDPYFTPDGWWRSREGEKTFLNEWTKTVANWFGV